MYLSCIGKLFADAGFQDILIESELVAAGSVDGVITGHHYNRSIRAHKLLVEALQRLRWQAYLDTFTQVDHAAALKVATDLQKTFPSEEFNAMLTYDAFLQLLKGGEKTLWGEITHTRPSHFGAHTSKWWKTCFSSLGQLERGTGLSIYQVCNICCPGFLHVTKSIMPGISQCIGLR